MAESREYRQQFWVRSGVFIAIIMAILVVVSFLWDRLSRYKIDFTQDSVYTISEPFEKILGNLTDQISVTYYVSDDLPSALVNLRRDTLDMFEEIKSLSGGRVVFEVIAPESSAEDFARAKVEKYKSIEADKGNLDELEPEPGQSIQDLFRGRQGKKTPADIRKERAARAQAIASKSERPVDDVRYELLQDEYKQKFLDDLQTDGIYPMRFPERQGTSVREISFYSGLKISYSTEHDETIPTYFQLNNLELELAQRILKMSITNKPKVAFFDSRAPADVPPQNPFQPSQGPQSDYQAVISQALQQFFDVRTVSMTEGDTIDDLKQTLADEAERSRDDSGNEPSENDTRISCLIVAQPDNLEERQVYEISKAISEGIPTILLVSRHSIDATGGPRAGYPLNFLNPGLDELFREYGIRLESEILGSNRHSQLIAILTVPGLNMPMESPYPFYCTVLATQEGKLMASDHPLLNRIPNLVFPATNGMTLDPKQFEKHSLNVQHLAWTDPETWSVQVAPFSQSPFGQGAQPATLLNGEHQNELVLDQRRRKKSAENTTFTDRKELAILLEGNFPFIYQDKEIPEWKPVEAPPAGGAPPGGLPPGFPGGLPGGFPGGGPQGGRGPQGPPAEGGAGATAEESKEAEATPAERPKGNVTPQPGRLLVLASVDGMKDRFLNLAQYRNQCPGFESNLKFFRNTIETFGLGDELLQLRRKTLVNRRFVDDTPGKRTFIQVVNIGLVPLAVAIIGLARYFIRRADSRAYERSKQD